jgi:hypothetical protein
VIQAIIKVHSLIDLISRPALTQAWDIYYQDLGVLLLNVNLSTPLARLAYVVLILGLGLGRLVACETCNSRANGARDAVSNARSKVVELTLSLLALASGILFVTFTLQALFEGLVYVNVEIIVWYGMVWAWRREWWKEEGRVQRG